MARLAVPLLCLIAPTAAAGSCPADLLTTQCNSVANKVPAVTTALPAGQSVEAGLSDADKESFEHLLGQGLRNSAAVRWVTTEFTKRAVAVVLSGHVADPNATETAVMGSFADPKFNRGNTGCPPLPPRSLAAPPRGPGLTPPAAAGTSGRTTLRSRTS